MNLPRFLAGGFGSCHSFDVAVGMRGYGMCQKRGRESLHGCGAVGGYDTNLNS